MAIQQYSGRLGLQPFMFLFAQPLEKSAKFFKVYGQI
jgi:hypothetical protein